MQEYKISGLPVVKDDRLVGIITNRDIRFETNDMLMVSDRMTSENLVTVPLEHHLKKQKTYYKNIVLKNYSLSTVIII